MVQTSQVAGPRILAKPPWIAADMPDQRAGDAHRHDRLDVRHLRQGLRDTPEVGHRRPIGIAAAHDVGAQVIELHTGAYCLAVRERPAEAGRILGTLRAGAAQATALGLEVHAGHGLDYETVTAIAAIPELAELNIGHFLIGEAIFIGLDPAIRRMRVLMDAARDEAAA